MIKPWVRVDDRVYASEVEAESGKRYPMTVERLSGVTWDWTVWSAERRDLSRYGVASSLSAALTAAEEAADALAAEIEEPRSPRNGSSEGG